MASRPLGMSLPGGVLKKVTESHRTKSG